jgi:hypothetical protein
MDRIPKHGAAPTLYVDNIMPLRDDGTVTIAGTVTGASILNPVVTQKIITDGKALMKDSVTIVNGAASATVEMAATLGALQLTCSGGAVEVPKLLINAGWRGTPEHNPCTTLSGYVYWACDASYTWQLSTLADPAIPAKMYCIRLGGLVCVHCDYTNWVAGNAGRMVLAPKIPVEFRQSSATVSYFPAYVVSNSISAMGKVRVDNLGSFDAYATMLSGNYAAGNCALMFDFIHVV